MWVAAASFVALALLVPAAGFAGQATCTRSTDTLYWGSGYSNFGFGTPNNKLYAFSLP